MARRNIVVTTEAEVALVAATAKTILQVVAPTNQRVAIKGFSVSFDGTSATAEPVQVDLVKQTTAGTMTAATPVAEQVGLGSETIQTTALKNATAEPTTTDVLRRYEIHPQTGREVRFSIDDEIVMAGGTRVGIRCTAPANVNALAHMSLEE
jgi:hypothetical protein